jgi:hypothetical protein
VINMATGKTRRMGKTLHHKSGKRRWKYALMLWRQRGQDARWQGMCGTDSARGLSSNCHGNAGETVGCRPQAPQIHRLCRHRHGDTAIPPMAGRAQHC